MLLAFATGRPAYHDTPIEGYYTTPAAGLARTRGHLTGFLRAPRTARRGLHAQTPPVLTCTAVRARSGDGVPPFAHGVLYVIPQATRMAALPVAAQFRLDIFPPVVAIVAAGSQRIAIAVGRLIVLVVAARLAIRHAEVSLIAALDLRLDLLDIDLSAPQRVTERLRRIAHRIQRAVLRHVGAVLHLAHGALRPEIRLAVKPAQGLLSLKVRLTLELARRRLCPQVRFTGQLAH